MKNDLADGAAPTPPRTFDSWLIAVMSAVGVFAVYGVVMVAQVA